MVVDGGEIVSPIPVQGWAVASDTNGLLDFPPDVHRFLAQDFDIIPVHLVTGFRFMFPPLIFKDVLRHFPRKANVNMARDHNYRDALREILN